MPRSRAKKERMAETGRCSHIHNPSDEGLSDAQLQSVVGEHNVPQFAYSPIPIGEQRKREHVHELLTLSAPHVTKKA